MIKQLALAILLTASAAHAEIYTWRAGGTDYYTNSLDEIPARYLKKARVLDVATGKKGPLATARPVAPPGTATAPAQAPAPVSGATSAAVPPPTTTASPTSTTAPPAAAPAPVIANTPPASTVPELSAPRSPSRESRSQGRFRRRAYDRHEEE
jgi:hypothetical protein